ncbi:hypothetical protein PFLUV_G00043220 [Perca fluviatilis]|uniref:Uncharacterized protein n=1 Tax=Perca fluviatilis TaxID=8168 RepID=A0A6A5FL44_PERFL|nr:hypothetical protein PFLUV_G00043220 [Perca fluviatilis]
MDIRRSSLLYPQSSPAGRFLRHVRGPPPSPGPQVPDVTEPNTGLEWFEMTASSSDRDVLWSPLVLANIQSSPLYNFAVPSTPVQDKLTFPLSLKEEFWIPESNSTVSPLVQTVPTFGEQELWERHHSFKSGPEASIEMTERKRSRGAKLQSKDTN